MSVVGYVRVSGLKQVSDGDGLGMQRERIEAWCRYQNLPLLRIEEDAGISGASTENRPGLKRALKHVLKHGKGAVLVVYKLDRLGRNALDVQEALAVLQAAEVRVVSITDGVDSANEMGIHMLRLLTNILATFAELDKVTINTRLADGRKRAKAQGKIYTNEAPYGLQRVELGAKELVSNDDESRAIERIKALRAEGQSYRQICQTLTEEGIKPRRASAWAPIVVQRIVTGKRSPTKAKTSERLERARAEMMQ